MATTAGAAPAPAPTAPGPAAARSAQHRTSATGDEGKTPVTIITGFLGAGKTTLLNYILKARNERNISVIENEFGEVNIDNELVADNLIEKEDLVSLDNGCVCCSLRKDVVKALAEIERRSRHRSKPVDQVILETTGLADPAPVAFTFFANPWIASRFRLDSIVCVCDTRYVLQHLDTIGGESAAINEAAQQLAFADLILLNKTDLVTPEQLQRVKAVVADINQNARLIECRLNQEGGRPPLSELLDSNAFSVHKALKVDPYFLDSDSGSDVGSDGETEEDEEATAEGGGATAAAAGPAANGAPDAAVAAAAAAAGAGPSGGGAADTATAGTAAGAGTPPGGGKGGCGAAAPQGTDEFGSDATHALVQQQAATAVAPATQQQQRKRPASPFNGGVVAGPDAAAVAAAGGGLSENERRPKRRRKHMHDVAGIGSVGIVARGPLDEYRFSMFMRDLLTEKAKDIFRCKGVLAVHGYGNQKFVFQGVHETICYGPSDRPWGEDEPRINQIVFIGRGLNRKSLMMGFKTCVWQPLPEGWREAYDPVTKQPYYYNPTTHEKTWARPQQGRPAAACDAVTVTPVVPMQQPRSLLPSRRRNGSQPGGNGANGGANGAGGHQGAASCASAPLHRNGSGAMLAAAGEVDKVGPPAVNGGGAALSDTL